MGYFLLKRILIFIPTLFVIALLSFWLSKKAPGDPILLFNQGSLIEAGLINDVKQSRKIYENTAERLGLDKPPFYFQFTSYAFPDTLYRILIKDHRISLKEMAIEFGKWDHIQDYYLKIQACQNALNHATSLTSTPAFNRANAQIKQLYTWESSAIAMNRHNALGQVLMADSVSSVQVRNAFRQMDASFQQMIDQPQRWRLFIPRFHWYGFDNQFHNWLSKFLVGDFGVSYRDGELVAKKIAPALRRTILLNGMAIVLAFLLAIPIGVVTAIYEGKPLDRWMMSFLFGLYSLPVFWIGTLLIVFLTTPEYGADWFPTMGLKDNNLSNDSSWWIKLVDLLHHLVLPLFCLVYPSLAFIARQMRNSTIKVLKTPYVMAAKAKGLKTHQILRRHVFGNAMFPIITLIAAIFPFLLAGAFIVEFLFNINGMGLVTVRAIFEQDWPIVFTILMLSALFTVIGILVADVLYQLFDPRIRLTNQD